MSLRRLDEQHRNKDLPYHDKNFYRLVRRGILDQSAFDRPWDASTRSMRYSAVLGDRLWEMVNFEREKVRISFGLS